MNPVHNRLTQAIKFASCSVIAVLAVSLVSLAVAQDDQQPDQDETAGALEEVVVTAMRRGEQVLTDIPEGGGRGTLSHRRGYAAMTYRTETNSRSMLMKM